MRLVVTRGLLFSLSLLFAGEKCSGLFLLFLFIYEKHMGRWQQVMCALSEVGSRQKRRRIAEAVHSELASCFESGDDCRSDDHSVNESAEQGGKVPLSDPTTRLSQSHSAFNLSCSLVTGEGDVCGLSSLSTESGTSILPNAEHVFSSSSGGQVSRVTVFAFATLKMWLHVRKHNSGLLWL